MTKDNLGFILASLFQRTKAHHGRKSMAAEAGSREIEFHPCTGSRDKERKQEVGRSYKPSQPTPSDELPPAGLHPLRAP